MQQAAAESRVKGKKNALQIYCPGILNSPKLDGLICWVVGIYYTIRCCHVHSSCAILLTIDVSSALQHRVYE